MSNKNRVIEWSIVGVGENGSRNTAQTFASKREAVAAMEAKRQPKTAVIRDGHTFLFKLAV